MSLYRDPHGERVLNTASASNVNPTTFSLDIDRENTSTVTQLQSRIAELESMLMECEVSELYYLKLFSVNLKLHTNLLL